MQAYKSLPPSPFIVDLRRLFSYYCYCQITNRKSTKFNLCLYNSIRWYTFQAKKNTFVDFYALHKSMEVILCSMIDF
nr:MAG TPA: hypothetical protein [Caudoviricetes sp.]